MADRNLTLSVGDDYVGSAFSPVVSIEDTAEGHEVTITDYDGDHSYVVPDWSKEEEGRAAAEQARQAAEAARSSAETVRAAAEASRSSAESARASAETSRASAESARASAENGRVSAESARAAAEQGRVSAEAARVESSSTAVDAANSAARAAGAAAGAASSAITRATEAAEAAEGIVMDNIPLMSANIRGGAKLGAGLAIVNGALELDGSGDIATAVSSWLDTHPEATTTVQDGSITKAKLASNIAANVLPIGTPVTLTWTRGKLLNSSGAVIDYSGSSYAVSDAIPVSPGDKFFATLRMNYGNSVYAVYDSNGTMIANKTVAGSALNYTLYEITVPSDAATMRFATCANYIEPDAVNTLGGYKFYAADAATREELSQSETVYDGMIEGEISVPLADGYIWTTNSGTKTSNVNSHASFAEPIRVTPGYRYVLSRYPGYNGGSFWAAWIEYDSSLTYLRSKSSEPRNVYVPSADAAYVVFTGTASGLDDPTIIEVEKIPVQAETVEATISDSGWWSTGGAWQTADTYKGTEKFDVTPGKTYHIQEQPEALGGFFFFCEYSEVGTFKRYISISDACRIKVSDDAFKLSITWGAVGKFASYESLTLEEVDTDGVWSGKKWVCVGDSLTENNQRTAMHYHDYIAEDTGITVVNMGVSGTGYKRHYDDTPTGKAFYQRIPNMPSDADVVTIFGSFNDGSYFEEIGNPADMTNATLCGCMNLAIDAVYEINPVVSLGIVAPTPWSSMPNDSNGYGQYVAALEAVCKRRGIPYLDLYHESGLRPWNAEFRELAYSHDDGSGVHPSEIGHALIAPKFKAFLETLIRID